LDIAPDEVTVKLDELEQRLHVLDYPRLLRQSAKAFPFAIHNVMNPMIEVSGDAARGRWHLLQPLTMARGNQAALACRPIPRRNASWHWQDK